MLSECSCVFIAQEIAPFLSPRRSPLKRLLSPFVLALLLVACAPLESGTGVPLNATHLYESYDARFTLAYQIDWAEVPRITLPLDTTFAAVSPDRRELLIATRDFDAQAPTLDAVLADVKQDYGDRLREAAIVPFNGRRAVRVVGDAMVEDRPVRLLQYLVMDGDRLYYLTLRAPPDAFAPLQGELEAIAASFKLQSPPRPSN